MTHLLVVDDLEANVYFLKALLGPSGYEVETAKNGAEALEKARARPPALLVCDLLMPVMDGYTLLRKWKSDPVLAKVPFVVYTATYVEAEDERFALDLGADLFIRKPADPETLLADLRRVIDGAAAGVAPRSPVVSDETRVLHDYSEVLIRKLEQKMRELEADIAARERVEAALRESEERFRQLAESIDDVYWLSDPDDREVFYVSPAYESVFGRGRDALVRAPKSWLDAVHAQDRERVEGSLEQYPTGRWDETFRIVLADGAVRWIRARAYPVRDASSRVVRVAGVLRDVTEYTSLEQQLRHAQKMEAVGRLAGGVAHDFNNLLSIILTYAHLIIAELSPAHPIRPEVEEIRRAGERASALTRQLLAFSRKQVLHPRVVDLGEIVEEMQTLLRRLLGEDIELSVRVTRPLGRVHADPSQIEQIVMNLAVNARDAMPDGGKLVIEVADVEGSAEGQVALVVRDTGMGMDGATRERIFEPFFTTKEQGKGTGLGLATVFGIVQQSRGEIHVESEPGAGTTFRVLFPCTDRTSDAAIPVRPAPTTLRGSERVLLVEDDAQVRETNRSILKRYGYEVVEASNGIEALAVLDRETVDLVITDVVMPKMSGRELAARIAERRPGTRMLFVSGYVESSMEIPEHALLEKPITPEMLLHRVRDLLARS